MQHGGLALLDWLWQSSFVQSLLSSHSAPVFPRWGRFLQEPQMDSLNILMPGNMTMAVAAYLREHGAVSLPQAQKLGVENNADLANIVHRLRKLHGMPIACADRRTKKYRQGLYPEYVLVNK